MTHTDLRAGVIAPWMEACRTDKRQAFLGQHLLTDRQLRLFACACCREIWDLLTDARSRDAVEVAERFADGIATGEELDAAGVAAGGAARAAWGAVWPAERAAGAAAGAAAWVAARGAARGAAGAAARAAAQAADQAASRARQGELLAAILAPGWEFDPAWRTTDVMLLAQGIYEEQAFDRMPILADALQDAGCDNEYWLSLMRTSTAWCRGAKILDDARGMP